MKVTTCVKGSFVPFCGLEGNRLGVAMNKVHKKMGGSMS